MDNFKPRMLTSLALERGQTIDPEYTLLKKVFDGVGMNLTPGILSVEAAAKFEQKKFKIIGICIYCTYKGKKYAIYKEADPLRKPGSMAADPERDKMIARLEKCIDNMEFNGTEAAPGPAGSEDAPAPGELPQLDIFQDSLYRNSDGNLRIKP